MKVLHVIPSVAPSRGGPSKAIIEMVAALISQGIDVEIATTNDDGPNELNVDLNKLIEYEGVPIRFFKRFSPPISALREFAYSNGFRRWLNAHIGQYDVIHVHALFSFTSSYTMRLARTRGIPYAVRPIGQLERWSLAQSKNRKSVFLALFERQNLMKASTLHFTAESEKTQALQALPELSSRNSAEVIPLGIKPTTSIVGARNRLIEHYDLDANKKILLYLSRLHPKKGLELLLEALKKIEPTSWQLLIAGDGERDYVHTLKQNIKRLGLSEHCHFIGFASGENKKILLQGADLYTLTSYSENFGIAVLEALAAGTPVLVSREVALSSPVEKHNLGYVCDVETDSIKAALQSAITDNGRTINEPSSYVKEHYSWELIAQKLHNTYTNIIKT